MRMLISTIALVSFLNSCGDGSAVNAVAAVTDTVPKCESEKTASPSPEVSSSEEPTARKAPAVVEAKPSTKLTMEGCIEPNLSKYAKGEQVTMCDLSVGYGTYEPEAPATIENCTRNGQTGCIATGRFAANDVTNLSAATILKGTTVAGVAGTYEAPTYEACSGNGQTGCLASASYPANNVSGLAPSNLRTGVTVAGIVGTFDPTVESHTNCSARNQTGCIATASFPTIDSASAALIVAANIKKDVVIAGVTGVYPSASAPLSGSTATADLDHATFSAKVKSSTPFEYFDSTGARHEDQGSDYIQEAYVRTGITIFGVAGTYGYTALDEFIIKAGNTVNGVTGRLRTDCRRGDATAPASEQCTNDGLTTYACSSVSCYLHRMTGKKWFRLGNVAAVETRTYAQVKADCESDTNDGGGWRLATHSELQFLLNSNPSNALKFGVNDAGFWAGPTATTVDVNGSAISYTPHSSTTGYRALCVKSP